MRIKAELQSFSRRRNTKAPQSHGELDFARQSFFPQPMNKVGGPYSLVFWFPSLNVFLSLTCFRDKEQQPFLFQSQRDRTCIWMFWWSSEFRKNQLTKWLKIIKKNHEIFFWIKIKTSTEFDIKAPWWWQKVSFNNDISAHLSRTHKEAGFFVECVHNQAFQDFSKVR